MISLCHAEREEDAEDASGIFKGGHGDEHGSAATIPCSWNCSGGPRHELLLRPHQRTAITLATIAVSNAILLNEAAGQPFPAQPEDVSSGLLQLRYRLVITLRWTRYTALTEHFAEQFQRSGEGAGTVERATTLPIVEVRPPEGPSYECVDPIFRTLGRKPGERSRSQFSRMPATCVRLSIRHDVGYATRSRNRMATRVRST